MNKYLRHLKTISRHKWLVMRLCFKCGRYKRGLMHDLSKFGPTEFWTSARYFQGDHSPIEAEKVEKGYSIAWQHHKGHNPHHWEYWIDNVGTRTNTPLPIPEEYIVEMICDWISAGIVYSGESPNYNEGYPVPLRYYFDHLSERIFEPNTQARIETYLNIVAIEGINVFCEYARHSREA